MGKKGKCKNEKSKRKYDRFKESNQQILNGSSDSDEKTSSVEDLAKVANCCVKCMKPINERNRKFIRNNSLKNQSYLMKNSDKTYLIKF